MHKLVVHCQKDKFDVYIGRGSKWGNTYSHIKNATTLALYEADTREDAISYFERDLIEKPKLIEAAQNELRGKILGCYCAPEACHGEVLVKYANTKTLYRPVGSKEYKLIEDSNFTKFPPRLPEQPIFYPVCNAEYAIQIAKDWNKEGHAVRFYIDSDFISKYETHVVGSKIHEEYWIPAEELEEFNSYIVGLIHSILEVKL